MTYLQPQFILFEIAIVYLSAVIQSSLGLGFAMLSSAVLPLFLPMVESTVLISIAVTVLGFYLTWKVRRYINYKVAFPAVAGLLIGKALGVMMLMHIHNDVLKRFLGFVLLSFAVFFVVGKELRIRPTVWKGLFLGILAGILGGLYNLAGPFLVIYFLSTCPDKYEYSASMNFSFAPASLLGTVMHYFYGNITQPILYLSIFNVAAVVAGILTGLSIFKHIDRKRMEKCLYILMGVMGVFLIITG